MAEGLEAAAEEAAVSSSRLIEMVGGGCVAIKPQLARFERFGAPGWAALNEVCRTAADAGLLVLADGKRGDVPHTAAAYAEALLSPADATDSLPGLGADAVTVNPLMGRDSVEPFVEVAERHGGAIFTLVRTSNSGAADLLDLETAGGVVRERIAGLTAGFSDRLMGECGLSGAGAVVGATEPRFIEGLRTRMPQAVMLLPGVGAQGGRPATLAAAFRPGRAAAIVPVSRSVSEAEDPAVAVAELRKALWAASGESF